jgi:branched-chain amino acid transport system permease protein
MVLFLIVLGIAPLFSAHPFYRHVITMIFLFAFLAEAWNLIAGYGGLFSLGHSAFFGVGAYATAILYVDYGISPWLGLFVGGLFGLFLALVIGLTTFRLRQFFFVLATLACAEAIHALFTYWRIKVPTGLGTTIPRELGFWNLTFASELSYTYTTYTLLVIIVLVTWLLNSSKIGYYLRAIGGNEDAAISLGVNALRVKLLILAISAFFTAMGGGFYAVYVNYIEPDIVFSVDLMIQYIVITIVGGMSTLAGPVVGSLLLVSLSTFFRGWVGGLLAPLGFFVYGIILVVVIILMPGGLMQALRTWADRILRNVRRTPQQGSQA